MQKHKHRNMKYHYYIRGAILLGFTTYIAYLAHIGKLNYYIVPRMIPYVMLTTLALYVLALYTIYLAWQERGRHGHEHATEHSIPHGHEYAAEHSVLHNHNHQATEHVHSHVHDHGHDCTCEHEPPRSKLKSGMIYSLFVFPLLLGFLLPDQLMGSDVVAVKGMNLSASQTANLQQARGDWTSTGGEEQAAANAAVDSSWENSPDRADEASTVDSSAAQTGEELDGSSRSSDGQSVNNQDGIAQNDDPQSVDRQNGNAQQSGDPQNGNPQSDNVRSSGGQDGTLQADNKQDNEEQNFEAMFPSDQYSVELAELGKLLYQQELIEVKEEGFLEMITTLDLFRENFIGKSIKLSGFVYREDDMGADSFVVSRMAMQCCSADASPYGFLVQSGEGKLLDKDTWVEVTGTLALTQYNGVEIVQLQNVTIQAIEAPDDPYVYPYFGYFPNIVAQ